MLPRIDIYVIDICLNAINIKTFNELNEFKKIEVIKDIMDNLLKSADPKAIKFVCMREYSIRQPRKKYISSAAKKKLKIDMSELAEKYDNVTIMVPVAVEKEVKSLEYLKKVRSNFNDPDVRLIELIEAKNSQIQMTQQKVEAERAIEEYPAGKKFSSLSNKVFLFNKLFEKKDEEQVRRHVKKAPFEETKRHQVYNLGTKKSKIDGLTQIPFLTEEKELKEILIGIEICYEHFHGLLSKKLVDPYIHFVFSATLSPLPKNMYGRNFVMIDSLNSPKIYSTQKPTDEKEKKDNIRLFVQDVTETDKKIEYISPIYPFHLVMIELIETALKENKKEQSTPLFISLNELKIYISKRSLKINETTFILQNALELLEPHLSKKWAAKLRKSLIDEYHKYILLPQYKKYLLIENITTYTQKTPGRLDNPELMKEKITLAHQFVKRLKEAQNEGDMNSVIDHHIALNKSLERKYNKTYYLFGHSEFEKLLKEPETTIKKVKKIR